MGTETPADYAQSDLRVSDVKQSEDADVAEALRTVEREALERAAQWQDINTAPKDGSKILAWDGDYVIVRADPNGGWSDDFEQYLSLDKWMPLPAPPAVKEGEG